MKVFVFGNEYMQNDSSAKRLAKEIVIKGVEFIDCISVSDLFNANEPSPVILDVVHGIKKPILITNIDQLQAPNSSSAHDMDLAFHLKLYKELGIIKDVRIIGIPENNVEKEEVKEIIGNL